MRSSGRRCDEQKDDLSRRNRKVAVLSATAYAGFIASPFQSWMDKLLREYPDDSRCTRISNGLEKLLASRGSLVEEKLLNWFSREHSDWSLLDLSGAVSKKNDAGRHGTTWYQARANETVEALKAAEARVLYQAPVYDSGRRFFGIIDFLIRGAEGDYTIWDTKLATHPTAYHVAQLIGYATALESMLGDSKVQKVGLVLGENAAEHGAVSEVSTDGLRASFNESWRAFEQFNKAFDPNHPPDPAEEPQAHLTRWGHAARDILASRDDPALIANITRSQRAALKMAGFGSMRSIAKMPREFTALSKVSQDTRIKPHTLERLRLQAKLQCRTRDLDEPASEVLPNAEIVLASLPEDDPGDIFIDLESLPWQKPPAASHYLIGVCTRHGSYRSWWSQTHDEEHRNTCYVLDFIFNRLDQFPRMHAYCYGHYERSAFSRLALGLPQKYKRLVNRFIETLLVDLYPILKGSIVLGLPGYGLKQVEKMYRTTRTDAVAAAEDSMIAYMHWLDAPDGDTCATSPTLRQIRDYNCEDCRSTRQLLTWLRQRCAGVPVSRDARPNHSSRSSRRSEKKTVQEEMKKAAADFRKAAAERCRL